MCDNCPVESVSWNNVQDFIKKLNAKTGKNYRLPTSLEWTYAAIGGENYEFERYDNYVPKTEYLDGSTQPVGQKKPNGYGLHDMTNNVWEWCDDWSDYYNGRHAESKVLCGHKRIENYASLKITENSNASGFRLAL
jgi:formylglycine-generating enzyme required for sulfatase activity